MVKEEVRCESHQCLNQVSGVWKDGNLGSAEYEGEKRLESCGSANYVLQCTNWRGKGPVEFVLAMMWKIKEFPMWVTTYSHPIISYVYKI